MTLPHQKPTHYTPPLNAPAAALGVSVKELKAALQFLGWIERGIFPFHATPAAVNLDLAYQECGGNEYGCQVSRIHITHKGMAQLAAYFRGDLLPVIKQ
ncbi:hypothetical protein [Alysiella filiformis]|uniref:Phage antirepressor protein KilAC domain-containing protein n=1 Tax=Alysiella filiformis DSM 16848 TaxID=1120981 RepID=A0A286E6R6_9NEIS|nr:hypothetical protein [Alysiella filiformis]QMT31526.1 hypothetical protein H3L97_01035 [Alysiella filiformis]UBQ55461.1 hypothetical protein JF568_07640 [Alysiella filiformis DSM 16848]SOD66602.1 hypothetical protein SAMN02746062_00664 [Alysiella filiformis DSM 16848]